MVARTIAPSVLIADAEAYVCRVFEAKLAKDNRFRVVCVTSALDAYQVVLEQPADILLWDMRLRETLRLLPLVRALCPHSALLLMTTDDRLILDPALSHLDVADILVKPFGLDILAERVGATLTLPQAVGPTAYMDLGHVGQRVSVHSPCGACETRVLAKGLDRFTLVGAPRVEAPEDFAAGLQVTVEMTGEDALYHFKTKLLRPLVEPVPCWELPLPRRIERHQRRKHPRMPLEGTIRLTRTEMPPNVKGAGTLTLWTGDAVEGQVENIGMGGCALTCEERLPVTAVLAFDLQLASENALEGTGCIMHARPLPLSEATTSITARYRYGLQFLTLNAALRSRLRHLFLR